MEKLRCVVERKTYENEENGYRLGGTGGMMEVWFTITY